MLSVKFKFLLPIFLLACLNVSAQVKPVYFEGDKLTDDKTKATSYGVYGKLTDSALWVLKLYDLEDNLIMTGSYKDELLSIPHGKFVYYADIFEFNEANQSYYNTAHSDRFISQDGNFRDGLKESIWQVYFPDGKTMGFWTYKEGIFDGKFTHFDKKGRRTYIGQYTANLKTGKWYDLKKRNLYLYENDQLIKKSKLNKLEVLNLE